MKICEVFMSLQEARQLGFVESFTSWERGYVSRRSSFAPQDIAVYQAGGIRNGLLFYRKPSWRSSRYCIRQYLVKRG